MITAASSCATAIAAAAAIAFFDLLDGYRRARRADSAPPVTDDSACRARLHPRDIAAALWLRPPWLHPPSAYEPRAAPPSTHTRPSPANQHME